MDYDPLDTVVSTQIRLARHIATQHASDVPAIDPSCERCTSDESRQIAGRARPGTPRPARLCPAGHRRSAVTLAVPDRGVVIGGA